MKQKIIMDVMRNATRSTEEDTTKWAAHLLAIIRVLGWKSVADRSQKKPNIRLARKYMRKNRKALTKLFNNDFPKLSETNAYAIIDIINPHLIYYWHAQIVGTADNAMIELLIPISPDSSD